MVKSCACDLNLYHCGVGDHLNQDQQNGFLLGGGGFLFPPPPPKKKKKKCVTFRIKGSRILESKNSADGTGYFVTKILSLNHVAYN